MLYKYIVFNCSSAEKDECDKSMAHFSDDSECSHSSINHLKDYEEDLYFSDTDKLEELTSENEVHSEAHKNVTYKVFTIGPADCVDQHVQVTHPVKKYRMLVRKKTEGVEVRIFSIFLSIES